MRRTLILAGEAAGFTNTSDLRAEIEELETTATSAPASPEPRYNPTAQRGPRRRGIKNARRVSHPLLTKDGSIPVMAAVKGRQHRTGVADTMFLGVRVSPANFAKLDRAATALGISKAALVDALLSRAEVDDQGRPLDWNSPVPGDQEELPLTRSA